MTSTLFVLMMYTYNMRFDGWTISGTMTQEQCEMVKAEIYEKASADFIVGKPHLAICKEVPSGGK